MYFHTSDITNKLTNMFPLTLSWLYYPFHNWENWSFRDLNWIKLSSQISKLMMLRFEAGNAWLQLPALKSFTFLLLLCHISNNHFLPILLFPLRCYLIKVMLDISRVGELPPLFNLPWMPQESYFFLKSWYSTTIILDYHLK